MPWSAPQVHGTPAIENFEYSLCNYCCHFGGHYSIDFGGKAECYATCQEMIANGRAANVACSAANCLMHEKCAALIPIPKACDEICENAAA
jgi:hypothetical protein